MAWNEYELLAGFVGPMLAMVQFYGEGFATFHQRSLRLVWHDYQATGTVDGLVASGRYYPQTPYFFIHEYKRSTGADSDPEGQLLVAMLAAYLSNANQQLLWGCYILGKFWHFVVLDGWQFATTQGYDASDPTELALIYNLLRHTKAQIAARVASHLN